MTGYILRYRADTQLGKRFPADPVPVARQTFETREKAEELRVLCANAEHIEVIPADEETT